MSTAFEISVDDIKIVASCLPEGMARTLDDDAAERLLKELDTRAIEKEALRGDDLDEQTDAAYLEIERQLLAKWNSIVENRSAGTAWSYRP
ncbi:MAG: hypothetical protein ING19_16785 [Azospirillum sp.]|nr:hypothetical protein [Azospirillum sp.]